MTLLGAKCFPTLEHTIDVLRHLILEFLSPNLHQRKTATMTAVATYEPQQPQGYLATSTEWTKIHHDTNLHMLVKAQDTFGFLNIVLVTLQTHFMNDTRPDQTTTASAPPLTTTSGSNTYSACSTKKDRLMDAIMEMVSTVQREQKPLRVRSCILTLTFFSHVCLSCVSISMTSRTRERDL
jgi:hypothetical protein